MKRARRFSVFLLLVGWGCAETPNEPVDSASWIAGDHHIHSRFSVGWDRTQEPPRPIVAGDAIYPIPMNALMARHYGLGWMVATDHGGPNHSRVSLELTYPELVMSREVVPDIVQYFGMEFDSPGADHSSLIVPRGSEEAERLHELESTYSRLEPWPRDPSWDTQERMILALRAMREMDDRPVVIANHPSRSAPGLGDYGRYDPAELRAWNDTAPEVAVGMAGAPGHQASTLEPDGEVRAAPRGAYANHPTMGGFDQMTARLGGFWDSMLGEGRRWWITANSDSHVNWREGGSDFWPGEYSKTYVWAPPTYEGVLDGLRGGRVFVALGGLVTELYVSAESGGESARIGESLSVSSGESVTVRIRWLDPTDPNSHGDDPSVARIDLIVGEVTGPVTDRAADTNASTRVATRWTADQWEEPEGPYRSVSYVLESVETNLYLRVRGTNGAELEPEPDPRGEDPWSDLWFYSNPIFVELAR